MDYEKAYKILFNAITDALTELEKSREKNWQMAKAEIILQSVQQQTENMYIETETTICFHEAAQAIKQHPAW